MAKYLDIAKDLRDRIRDGRYPVGSALPGLTDLKEQYDASLNTVRAAQDLLRQEGLLRIAQGEGAFVLKAPEWSRTDILDSLRTATATLEATIVGIERQAPAPAADPFDVGTLLTREQRLDGLKAKFEQHDGDDGVPVLGEEELIVVAELLGELNARANPGPGADTDGWGWLAAQMASRIYSRLGI